MTSRPTSPRNVGDTAHCAPVHRQLAALCYRKASKAGREVLLVTSSTGRWILPKGWPIDGLNGAEVALVEAWEEAGIKRGKASRKPVGSFIGTKISTHGDEEPCLTRVYAIKVHKTVTDYPEADRRDRLWVSPEKAARMVQEEGLQEILRDFAD